MKISHPAKRFLLIALCSSAALNSVLLAADAPTTAAPAPSTSTTSAPATTAPAAPAATDAPAAPKVNTAIVPVKRDPLGAFMDFHDRYVARAKQGNLDLLYVGDSITNQFQVDNIGKPVWDKYYGSMNAADFGHNGDGIQHILWRLQNGEEEGFTPKVVVLMEGTNNLGANTVPEIVEGITVTVNDFRKRWPSAKILVLGIPPRGLTSDFSTPARKKIADVNQGASKLEDGKHVFFFDLGPYFLNPDGTLSSDVLSDGTHPTAYGYTIWAEALKEPLANLMQGKDLYGFPIPADAATATSATTK